ncbi:hypothetical protein PHLGIDRAFT_14647 [Phlebiopsis gigantea 11061_1 CR5-6]|uniref:Uncharacterized protein n=1 Tax=Phlebiopsis gigantea (strain 11061_1 CR5-6) TaxID=745531 RepID=A0A0C3RVF9_PHLG1|nr:hypothetical protein PHLGIDRAFT_14647 [Phlebiopsis gigantea 11061_1 CR5-6]
MYFTPAFTFSVLAARGGLGAADGLMGPVQWEYKALPRRERPMDADDVLNDSAFAEDTTNVVGDEDVDEVTPFLDDVTPGSDAMYACYTEAERDAASAFFNMDPGFAPQAATGADDAGFPQLKTTKATEYEDTTVYSDLRYASFVSLEDTLVGSAGDLHGCAFDAKMDVFDTEAAEDIVVDDDEDHMITTGTTDSDLDVHMADASRHCKLKFTKALKRVLAPAVAGPKKILIGLTSKRNFAPYNRLCSRSRRVLARSSGAADFPNGR